jgi:tetratricopeptide (TPR) repeat protein
MGELLISAGDYQAGREHLTCALNLAIEMDDRECQACTSRWLGRSYELQGEYEQALSWLERGTVALNGLDSTEAVELSLVAGLIKVRQGQYDDASNLCRRGLQLALKLGDLAVEARTYNLMGIVDRRRGDSACAIVRFNQALVIYRQLANVYGEATSHNLIATSEIAQGNWREAESHYRRSLDLFTQIGDIYNQVLVNSNLGSISLRQGRLDEALDYYQKSTALLVQIGGSLWVIGALHMNTANAQIQKGDLDGAIKNLEIAQDHFAQAKSRDLLPELYGLLSEAALRQGHLEEAETHGQKSVALARELKMRREEGHNLRILGEIAQAKNQLDKAKRLLAESYTVLSEVDDAYERSKAQLSLVHLHLAMGEHQAAASELRDCEETFTLLGAELDLERVAEYRLVLTRRFATTHQRQ